MRPEDSPMVAPSRPASITVCRRTSHDVVTLTLSSLAFTRASVADLGPYPVYTKAQWRDIALNQHRHTLHAVAVPRSTHDGPRQGTSTSPKARAVKRSHSVPRCAEPECATVASADAAETAVYALSLYPPHNRHLHFYTRAEHMPVRDETMKDDGHDTRLSAAKARKVELVAYRRASSLAAMNNRAVVRVAVTPAAATHERKTASDSVEDDDADAGPTSERPRRLVDIRRQLPHVGFASSLWAPSLCTGDVEEVPERANYPVIRAVPSLFSVQQLCGMAYTPLLGDGGFRRTWGLKEVNAHVVTHRNSCNVEVTSPPSQSAPSSTSSEPSRQHCERPRNVEKRKRL